MEAKLTLNIKGMPEVIWKCRKALADLLRSEAKGEPRIVAAKLEEVAAKFESGVGQA